jgi:transcriptional repressor of cell division inhibition gene dicB
MNKSQAIRFAGSAAALARLLGVTPSAVSQWSEDIPPLQVYRLKELKPRWFARLRRESRQGI